jgi:nucleotide-binding universal stress UspA family protein
MSTMLALQPMKILLAVDGSDHAMAAIDLVHDMPLPLDSHILVLAVLIPREAGLKSYALRHFVERTEEKLQDKGAQVTTHLLTGDPAVEIIRQANLIRAELIVMGARGLRATLGILLGGVVQQVVEHATTPVLVVRAPYEGIQNMLLVSDGSQPSEKALQFVTKFPFAREARLQLVHVLPPEHSPEILSRAWVGASEAMFTYSTPELEEEFARSIAEEEKMGQALLAENKDLLEKGGVTAETVLLRGDAATEILSFTREKAIDLIVAGSRGLGGFEGWLLGSVSRKLVHYAGCSVLIVKGE